MNWHDRFKAMKKSLGYTNKDIAQITDLSYDSIKNQTQPNKEIPKWLKLSIVIFERLSGSEKEN
jgi:DNA-binding XRE family transcriptional regulator